ncbi:MAG: hypothetical protein HYY83_03165, partial [Deltaproteobacteria bacterium]|nr:hypothetical protein [Deltaproteobacteria bacterium]
MKNVLRWPLPLALCAALVGLPFPLTAQEGRHLAGRLLVATPELGDPNFSHTVIY